MTTSEPNKFRTEEGDLVPVDEETTEVETTETEENK